MEGSQAPGRLRRRFERFASQAERPRRCPFCPSTRVWWDGSRARSASVRVASRSLYLPAVRCRRVQCAGCRRSWPLRPAGLMPRRHYQLCVVAQAMSRHLFDGISQEQVAAEVGCSRRTVGRWLRWLAACADPGVLGRMLLVAVGTPVLPRLRALAPRLRALRDAARRQLLERAATVLQLFEALGLAWGREPPGLRGVIERVLAGRDRITSYRAPLIPELARRHPLLE